MTAPQRTAVTAPQRTAVTAAQRTAVTAAQASCLVTLDAAGEYPAGHPCLVLLPPFGGSPGVYGDLVARLGTTHRVLGFQSYGLVAAEPGDADRSVPAMAHRYAGELARADIPRRCLLVGYSMGGVLAVETARRYAGSAAGRVEVLLVDSEPTYPALRGAAPWHVLIRDVLRIDLDPAALDALGGSRRPRHRALRTGGTGGRLGRSGPARRAAAIPARRLMADLFERMTMTGHAPTPDTVRDRVVGWWSDLLDTPVGWHDDFFDLGGTSLTLVRFVTRVQGAYGVSLPLAELLTTDFTATEVARTIVARVTAATPPDGTGREEP